MFLTFSYGCWLFLSFFLVVWICCMSFTCLLSLLALSPCLSLCHGVAACLYLPPLLAGFSHNLSCSMELLYVSYCLSWWLPASYSPYSPMELLDVSHRLMWLIAVSYCLSGLLSSGCLSMSPVVTGCLSLSLRSHRVATCLSLSLYCWWTSLNVTLSSMDSLHVS